MAKKKESEPEPMAIELVEFEEVPECELTLKQELFCRCYSH
jgi:hypothetical protein